MKRVQFLNDGHLAEVLSEVEANIRSHPGDVKHRIFLFQLLVVLGDWNRAVKQLDVITKLDDGALAMVHVYRSAIECEIFREAVFSGSKDPVFMGKPEEWQALMLQALKLTSKNKDVESQILRNQAFDMASASSGSINGDAFEWIADADPRFGPLLEVFVNGRYYWVPFSNIARMEIEEPEDLRDVVWMPAHIQWLTEGESFVLIPTRYPFSSTQDDALALSRKTEWESREAELYVGYGQRLFTTNLEDYPIMDLRELTISSDSSDQDTLDNA